MAASQRENVFHVLNELCCTATILIKEEVDQKNGLDNRQFRAHAYWISKTFCRPNKPYKQQIFDFVESGQTQ